MSRRRKSYNDRRADLIEKESALLKKLSFQQLASVPAENVKKTKLDLLRVRSTLANFHKHPNPLMRNWT